MKYLVIIYILSLSSVLADEISDTTDISLSRDTTYLDQSVYDSLHIDADTLTDTQRAYLLFKNRQAKRKAKQKKEVKEVKTYLSFYDSLVTTFLHPRLNSSTEITRAFAKDAGDYYRVDPSYFVEDFQQTPSRKTVRPFGLSGNRMNIIVNGLVMAPFEHLPEPDGLIDFNDIPTGLTKDIYILPGGAGQLFGGKQSIATLVTVPYQPESYQPEIKLQVDKGAFDYAFTRGSYTKLFSNGKEVDLSVDYRNSSGLRANTQDNGKHYAGRTVVPLNSSYFLNASGSSYRRKGSYKVGESISSPHIIRNRTDRKGLISIEKLNEKQNVKYHLGYEYIKQNSNIDNAYKGRFNFFGNEIDFTRESIFGSKLIKSEISYSYLEQTDGFDTDSKKSAKVSSSLLQKNDNSSFGMTVGTFYNNEYDFLPFTSLVYQKFSEKHFMMVSVGYSKKAPSMHDTNLKFQKTALYTTDTSYADVGNKNLLPEKQLVGSFMYEYGSLKNNIRLSITGGLISDGIDWYDVDTVIETISLKLFNPKNSDMTFIDLQLKQKYSLNNLLNLSFGGAYHYIDYDIVNKRAYQPEYQLFFGGELHQYWKQKLINLYAYGEVQYVGPYRGYFDEPLGENIIVNTGLAFDLKRFRFYYIFQNSIDVSKPHPDSFNSLGQYSYYGLTWYFLN